ncbi:MAG: hypothetical protein JRJ03_12280 [Deltaproteobacteria bacterium]|nr:hypothetical protein [Deltaproteobacteria bacterium]
MAFKENATQFSTSGGNDFSDIVIGFDFGTSCTKIVLQDTILRNAFAVPFVDKGHQNNVYLLPTKLGFTKHGECKIAGLNEQGRGGLKYQLMTNPERSAHVKAESRLQTNVSALVSAYIALALRKARLWFLENFQTDYGKNSIRWHFNLGIPTRNYDDRSIYVAFLRAAYAGWWLSIQEGPVTVHAANDAFAKAMAGEFDPGLNPGVINIVPEVAAEVASYARSYRRQSGLHMIVDVGAGTMDIATFRLESTEGGDEYGFLWAEVCDYACKKLHDYRLDYAKKYLDHWITELSKIDETFPEIPSSPDKYVPPALDRSLVEADRCFLEEAKKAISRVAAISYTKKDPNASEWKSGVPLFLCGGGANLSIFKEQLVRKAEDMLKNYEIARFQSRSLTKPENLRAEGLRQNEYHRLAVAYGLSFFYDDIGKIVPPSEIEDTKRIERIKVVDPVTKEMV